MARRKEKSKSGLMRIASQSMAIAMTVATVLTISPIAAHAAPDTVPPTFTGAESSNGESVYLNFDEAFTINAPDGLDETEITAYLKSKISVAADGEHFAPVSEQQSEVYQSESDQIYIDYDNDMQVILGAATIIKIASGTLKDQAGNLNEEMNLHVSPPVIQSTAISSDNHDVTITFNEDVFDNTDSNLGSSIYLIRGTQSNWKGLVEGDAVSIDSGKLQIHFAEALSGADNQISIDGNALKDSYGNVQADSRLTALITANAGGVDPAPADTTMPVYQSSYFSSPQDLNIVFDEDVYNALENDESFLQNIQWYNSNNWEYSLPADTTLTFSGHVATIHFAAPLTGYQYYFSFYPGHFKDAAGNISDASVNTEWFYQLNTEIGLSNGYFSHDGRWMSLEFYSDSNSELVDYTLADGVSHLKEQITISTDHGLTYAALDELDTLLLKGNKITVFFHDGKKGGSIKVKVAANVVGFSNGYQRNLAIDQEIAYNTPDITGYVLSNAASEFVFADNAQWRSQVKVIRLYDDTVGTYRELNSSEYALTEGKLTIASGVFQEGHYYDFYVDAAGYSTKYFEGRAYKSSEVFYVTAPEVSALNGITAKINLFNNAYENDSIGNQTVVFELFNGSTPVSIVAANLKVNTGTYSANFNVNDAASNPNYTVKVFVVSKYSSEAAGLGLNLATVKTQLELDQAMSMVQDYHNAT
ncbi:Ig-like domain-containing protein [Paenibacillus sepulcri]|uniref:Ig-like domain-containing protein n=1 Tax=Paenibacillus sepulcri TaxID=359917 RepID=A0ABS7BZ05_9BACL|nr:Ig-like domain-containing protein [Paenibacillus sepulcri]